MSDDPDKPKKKPKTKTQPVKGGSGSGSRKPPQKTALGYGGGGDGPKFSLGESLACRVIRKFSASVYVVTILKHNIEAHLYTEHSYAPGTELIAQFEKWKQGIACLTQIETVNDWLEPFPSETSKQKRKSVNFERKANPKTQLRRACDLIMPPLDEDSIQGLRIGDYELDWLITDLESGMRTGCVKVNSEKSRSRGAILVYRGRVVGCISGSEANPEAQPTEESLNAVLKVMCDPDTTVSLYDLPEDIVLSMSALFLGYPVKRDDDYNSLEYFNYIVDWFNKEKGTATIAISLSGGRGMCLAYVFKGEFVGAFLVEDQKFLAEINDFRGHLEEDINSNLGVSVLPPEMTSKAINFGFSLSFALNRIRDDDAS